MRRGEIYRAAVVCHPNIPVTHQGAINLPPTGSYIYLQHAPLSVKLGGPSYGLVETAFNRGVILGYGNSRLRRGNKATRGQSRDYRASGYAALSEAGSTAGDPT